MSIISNFDSFIKAFSVSSLCRILLYGIISLLIIIILLRVVKEQENVKLYWNHSANFTSNRTQSGYVTMRVFSGRLGNQMFMLATMFYVALKTNREVVLFNDHNGYELEKYFSLGVRKINRSCPCFIFSENLQSYDIRMDKIITSQAATNSQTIILYGSFQSWKYLEPVKNLVRTHMKFRKNTEVLAKDFLRENIPKGWTEGKFTRVGIHSRRGDFLGDWWNSIGVTAAPDSYFKKAMKYFVDRHKLVQFIVASDDINWSRENITYDSHSSSVNVTYSENHSPGEDMAILSRCNHVIVSIGTFGWMAAWLANGTTVYYSNFPRNGTRLAGLINRLDYYPSHWIPMQ